MGTQEFCLRWNNHQTNLLSVFDQLLQTESFVDVTLACDGLSLKAHKVVLSACSPYFQRLLLDNPCQHPIVILNHVNYVDLRCLIDFMYKGEVNVQQDQLQELLKTAELLKIKGLSEAEPSPISPPTTDATSGVRWTSATGQQSSSSTGGASGVVRSAKVAGIHQSPAAKRKRGRPRKANDTRTQSGMSSSSSVLDSRLAMDGDDASDAEEVDGIMQCRLLDEPSIGLDGEVEIGETCPAQSPGHLADNSQHDNNELMVTAKVELDDDSELAEPHIDLQDEFNTNNDDVNSSNMESPSFLGMATFPPSSSSQSYTSAMPSTISQPTSGECGVWPKMLATTTWSREHLVSAVTDVVHSGLALRAASSQYGIPKTTLIRYTRRYRQENVNGLDVQRWFETGNSKPDIIIERVPVTKL